MQDEMWALCEKQSNKASWQKCQKIDWLWDRQWLFKQDSNVAAIKKKLIRQSQSTLKMLSSKDTINRVKMQAKFL